MTSGPVSPSPIRTILPWVLAAVSSSIAVFYLILLARDPSLTVAWFGFACFAIAAAGSIYTIIADRRSRR